MRQKGGCNVDAAVERGRGFEPLQKMMRLRGDQPRHEPMEIDNLVYRDAPGKGGSTSKKRMKRDTYSKF